MNKTRRLIYLVLLLSNILFLGTIGFVIIESWNPLDAFYFTLITITTIGYQEVHSLSTEGRMFTIFLIFFGVGSTLYLISTTAEIVLEGHLKDFFGSKRMQKGIKKLKNHYIICGFGRIGSFICEELHKQKKPFVVIESNEERFKELLKKDYLHINADAAFDQTLIDARIKEASALVIVVGHDADSVFITLSGRGLNESVFILARYDQANTEQKLRKAGANKVISPYLIGGGKMVQLLLRPTVTDFIEITTSGDMVGLVFEEILLGKDSSLVNHTLQSSQLRQDFGVIVVGVKNKEGKMTFNPPFDTVLNASDTIIVLGNFNQVEELRLLQLAAKK